MAPNMKQLIIKVFMSVTPASTTLQVNDWLICDERWFQILTYRISSLKDSVNINHTSVIKSISSLAVPLNSKGDSRIYHKIFQMDCPFATSSERNVHFAIMIQHHHHNVLMLLVQFLIHFACNLGS